MHVLVMGGTEFVGAALARHLVTCGYDVDILTRGVRACECEGIRAHLKADRRSPESLRHAIGDREYEVVYDISAYTRGDVANLHHVLNRRNLRFWFFCSSGAVYLPSNDLIVEDYPRGANSNWGEYGRDKKEAEDYLFELHSTEDLPAVIFRPTYIYGPENNLYRESYLFDRIATGRPLPIPAGETVGNQFVHIDDLVRTFESGIGCGEAIGKAFNLTHPEIVTWRRLAEIAMEVVGRDVEVVEVGEAQLRRDGVEVREFFPFRQVTYTLDTTRLRSTFSCVPSIALREGLARTYEWYCRTKPRLSDPRMTKVEMVLQRVGV